LNPGGERAGLGSKLRTARTFAAGQRSYLGYRSFLPPWGHRIAYIGWTGQDNMGDEAMYEAHRQVFPELHFAPCPNLGPNLVLGTVARLRRGALVDGVCLGGGTLIGNGYFRRTLESVLAVSEGTPRFMLGVGVEDPDFVGTRRRNGSTELQRWVDLLGEFDKVCVRGPLSQQALSDVGIASDVVGDPALILGDAAPVEEVDDRLLGINVGVTDDLWGNDLGAVQAHVTSFAQTMIHRGWRIRFVPLWPKDLRYTRDIARQLGDQVEVFDDYLDLDKLLGALRECTTFVGEKLHSVILASAVFVPSVALEYRPKCRDFQCSIGRERYTVRTDQLDHDRLVDMVDDLERHREHHSRALAEAVGRRRRDIRAHVRRIRDDLGHLC
jgi:polysaccharide pyruvyl transferase WcaK-like protein